MLILKIVSGGQTGVDRGALEAAVALGLDFGGWAPYGWIAEDGTIPAQYRERMQEHPAAEKSGNPDNPMDMLGRRQLARRMQASV